MIKKHLLKEREIAIRIVNVKNVLDAIFINSRKALKNDNVSIKKNSRQYIKETENIRKDDFKICLSHNDIGFIN